MKTKKNVKCYKSQRKREQAKKAFVQICTKKENCLPSFFIII